MISAKDKMEILDRLRKHEYPWVRRYMARRDVTAEDRDSIIRFTLEEFWNIIDIGMPPSPDRCEQANNIIMALVHAGIEPFEVIRGEYLRAEEALLGGLKP